MAKGKRSTTSTPTQPTTKERSVNKILPLKVRLKCKNTKQKDFVNLIKEKEIVLCSGPAGVGKAQPLYSKILTPNGWTTMGEIRVGDEVLTPEGKPTKVIQIHPQGIKEIYRVYFNDSSYTDCCDEHLWLTDTYYDRNYRVKKGGKRFYSPRKGHVKPLSEIMETLNTSRGDKNHTIPLVKSIEFEEKELFIDPYVLGCLLGDGGLTQNRITFTTQDTEIVELISERLNDYHTINKKSGKYQYSIIGENNNNEILNNLNELNLKNIATINKKIPDKYLFNTKKVRLEVLRGLMDTDGYVNKNGTSTFFTNTSKDLIDGVCFIVNSLGGVFKLNDKIGSYIDNNGEKILCKKAYTLTISLPPEDNLFKLKRKAQLVKPKTKYIPKRYITDIEPIGQSEAKCISIDSKDSLYITDNFIVTHNSFVAIAVALELLQDPDNSFNKILIVKPAVEAEENLGFLPGNLKEKLEPYLAASIDIVDKIIGEDGRRKLEDSKELMVEPLGFIRGKTLDNSILIGEEAQNMSPSQMKSLLTRIGYGSKYIVSGDMDQSDRYDDATKTGLYDAMNRHRNIDEIGFFEFDENDIVRNPLITKMVRNYKKPDTDK